MKRKEHNFESSFDSYSKDVEKTVLLTAAEELELIERIQQGDKEAFEKLIVSNVRLVLKIAYRYRTSRSSFLEIIQEGNMGLIHAAGRFDPQRRVRFSTYATWWIRCFIQRYLNKHQQLIYIPPQKMQRILRLQENKDTSEGHHGSKSSRFDRKAALLLNYPKVVDDADSVKKASAYEDYSFSPEDILERKMKMEMMTKIMDMLREEDREIAQMYFPLDGSKPATPAEIARKFQISTDKVRSIVRRTRNMVQKIICTASVANI